MESKHGSHNSSAELSDVRRNVRLSGCELVFIPELVLQLYQILLHLRLLFQMMYLGLNFLILFAVPYLFECVVDDFDHRILMVDESLLKLTLVLNQYCLSLFGSVLDSLLLSNCSCLGQTLVLLSEYRRLFFSHFYGFAFYYQFTRRCLGDVGTLEGRSGVGIQSQEGCGLLFDLLVLELLQHYSRSVFLVLLLNHVIRLL